MNHPTPDGYLHTWAPVPADMARVIAELFPTEALPAILPTVSVLITLDLTEASLYSPERTYASA